MTDNVTKFYPRNAAEKADNVLEQSLGAYKSVLILGWDHNGNMEARATLDFADGGEVLWLLENFKFQLLAGEYAGDPE